MYGELWLNIGITGYKVSNIGNVANKKGELLKGSFNKRGDRTDRTVNIKGKVWRVNRLVATYFIPNPLNLPQVNHKDENPLNNDASNLEWCTPIYNMRYGTRTERQIKTRRKNAHSSDYLAGISVIGIPIETGEIIEYQAINQAKKDGILYYGVRECLLGISKTYKGYTWHLNNKNKEDIIEEEFYRRNNLRVMKSFINNNIKILDIIKKNAFILNNYNSVRNFLINYNEVNNHLETIRKEIDYIDIDVTEDFLSIATYLSDGKNLIFRSAEKLKIKGKNLSLLSDLIDGKSIENISQRTGESKNTVFKRLNRLVKKINKANC